MEFNEKLQELRKQKGLTQEELAEKLYVSRTAISKWESGRGYPSIDSLKTIAKFFSVTVDQLLSADEVLSLAEEQQMQTKTHFTDLVFGLLDLSMVLLLFLPLFAERSGEVIKEVSVLTFSGARPLMQLSYFTTVILIAITGVLTLACQNCKVSIWLKSKVKASLILSVAAIFLFVMTLQPYAAVFTFALLLIKALVILKRK